MCFMVSSCITSPSRKITVEWMRLLFWDASKYQICRTTPLLGQEDVQYFDAQEVDHCLGGHCQLDEYDLEWLRSIKPSMPIFQQSHGILDRWKAHMGRAMRMTHRSQRGFDPNWEGPYAHTPTTASISEIYNEIDKNFSLMINSWKKNSFLSNLDYHISSPYMTALSP